MFYGHGFNAGKTTNSAKSDSPATAGNLLDWLVSWGIICRLNPLEKSYANYFNVLQDHSPDVLF